MKPQMQLPSQNDESWAFVVNRIAIECQLPFELAPGCVIAKANQIQMGCIKTELIKYQEITQWHPTLRYECETVIEDGNRLVQVDLEEPNWHYYVVASPDREATNRKLQFAVNISDTPLDLTSLQFFADNNGNLRYPPELLAHLNNIQPARRVSLSTLTEIREIYQSLTKLDSEVGIENRFPEITRAFEMIASLSLIARYPDFHALGLFSIIEMLLTHKPKSHETGDSISHQIQTKFPLVAHRFDKPVEYKKFFGDIEEKKALALLYGYRSTIAHGGKVNFQSADWKVLKGVENIKNFLYTFVRALLRNYLKEPYLYEDLRKC